jgi:hypothetical protein
MLKLSGIAGAAFLALGLVTAPANQAAAAPLPAEAGVLLRDGAPGAVEQAGWRGRRVVVVHRYRPYRGYYRPYRPYRPAYHRPYYRPAYYGPRCFWRPARSVWTPYGWRWRPAARICRW